MSKPSLTQIKINNRTGEEWDVSEIVTDISLTSSRIGAAGKLTFTLIKGALYQSKQFAIRNGDFVRVKKDGLEVFYGYIFIIDGGRDEEIKITAYDQIRYLMNTETYVFSNITATEVLKRIAKDFNLKLGPVADTAYKIATMSEDGQKLLDIICKAITITFANTGKDYCLYDRAGELCLVASDDFELDLVLGDGSLVYDFSVQQSIDSDTYNKIKLYKDNKETLKREVYVAQDSVNIKQWGMLMLYQSVDEKMNKGQIDELLEKLAFMKNRETKSLSIEALGDIRVRAGMRVQVSLESYGVNQSLLIDQCTHKIDGADHTMSLDLRVV